MKKILLSLFVLMAVFSLGTVAEAKMVLKLGHYANAEQADEAMQAGVSFIVAPGFDPEVVDYCLERDILVMPGICTASELTQAVLRKLPAVKFFPAEAMGGLQTLKNLAAPFPPMDFMVTGGLSRDNMASYLAWERILAIGGSWMVKKDLLIAEDYDQVSRLTAEAVQMVREHRR